MKHPKPARAAKTRPAPEPTTPVQHADLILRGDTVGLRLARAAGLRRKRKLEPADRAFLRELDADLAKVRETPDAAWQEGLALAQRGRILIELIIRERRALARPAGGLDPTLHNAVCCLMSIIRGFRDDLVRHAEEGQDWACEILFAEGHALAEAFSRLALAHPAHFQSAAEHSLTMPSLRAQDPAFTCDAAAIAAAVNLAGKHPAPHLHDNRSPIGALCHLLVANLVGLIEAVRQETRQQDAAAHPYAGLPELHGHARIWWDSVIKARVHREFAALRKHPLRNPALKRELERLTDNGTDAAQRAALEKYCYNKLEQIAARQPAPA